MSFDRATASYPAATDSDGMVQQYARPYELDGVAFFPASGMGAGVAECISSNDMLVQLDLRTETLAGNEFGVFMRFTPEGARELAGHLMANAQQVEAHVAQQAAAAIEAARAKGGQS